MEQVSQTLFTIGTIVLAFAFAAYVGHAVLIANGRRALADAGAAAASAAAQALGAPRPAWAGVATGSFVTTRAAAAARGPQDYAAPSPLSSASTWLGIAAFALLAASMLLRAVIVGRGPWGNLFEFSVAFATSILGGYLVLQRRYPIKTIGFIPVGISLGMALYASSLPHEINPLVPALQNPPLLTIHVGLAMLSYGIFATSFAAGVGYLIQGREDRFAWLPSHKVLDQVAYRAVIVGFPVFATMIILGSWWASIAWSAYWSWDPKETAALVTWLAYAIYLHARNQKAWAGRPAALLLVVAFGMVLVTYSGSLWFNGLHAYSGL
jgi:cytochrome c-type biogenesis protein CcsB